MMRFLKKNVKPFFVMLSLLGVVACGSDESNERTPLSAQDFKAKLETSGLDFLSKFNSDDQKTAINSLSDLIEFMEIGGLIPSKSVDNSGTTPNYPPHNLIKSVMQTIQENDVKALARATSQAMGLSEYAGVYTYDPQDQEWTTASATGKIEMSYKNKLNEACLLILTFENEKEIIVNGQEVRVPQTLVLTLKVGATDHIILNLIPNVVSELESGALAASLWLNGGYEWRLSLNFTTAKATETFSLTKNGEKLIDASINLSGEEFNDFDKAKVNTADVKFKIMDVDLNGSADVKGIQNGLKDITGNPDSKKNTEIKAALYNQFAQIGMYYGELSKVAEVKIESVFDGNYGGADYYYITPRLIFVSDGSKYDLDNYFDKSGFSNFIKSFEELMSRYEILF